MKQNEKKYLYTTFGTFEGIYKDGSKTKLTIK
jgi:hypothetical protein